MKKISKLLISTLLLINSHYIYADNIPSLDLLKDINSKIYKSNICKSDCNTIEKLSISGDKKELIFKIQTSSTGYSELMLPIQSEFNVSSITLDGKPWTKNRKDNSKLFSAIPEGVHELTLTLQMPETNKKILLPNIKLLENEHPNITSSFEGNNYYISITSNYKNEKVNEIENTINVPIEPFYLLERKIVLNKDNWKVINTLSSLSPIKKNITIDLPLLENELPINKEYKDKSITASLDSQNINFSWESNLKKVNKITLNNKSNIIEEWTINYKNDYLLKFEGKQPNFKQNYNGTTIKKWTTTDKETLTLNIENPNVAQGNNTVSLLNKVNYTEETNKLYLTQESIIETTIAEDIVLEIPNDFKVEELTLNGNSQIFDKKKKDILLTILPGKNSIVVKASKDYDFSSLFYLDKINLKNIELRNLSYHFSKSLSEKNISFFAGGTEFSPIFLVIPNLLLLILVCLVYKKCEFKTVKYYDLFFMCFLFCFVSFKFIMVILMTFLVFYLREKFNKQIQELSPTIFNLLQVFLVLSFLFFIGSLLSNLTNNLIGTYYDLTFIDGLNSSSSESLNWYQFLDYGRPYIVQLNSIIYKIVAFIWSFWLVNKLFGLLKSFWEIFSLDCYWKNSPIDNTNNNISNQDIENIDNK